MIIGEGSTHQVKIYNQKAAIIIEQNDRWVKIHIDDLTEVINALSNIKNADANDDQEP